MRAALSLAFVLLAACGQQPDGDAAIANNAAVTEVETLPPDESVATPTNQLISGDDEAAAGNDLTAIKGDRPYD